MVDLLDRFGGGSLSSDFDGIFSLESFIILLTSLFNGRLLLDCSSGGREHNEGDSVVSELEFDVEHNWGSDTCPTVPSISMVPDDEDTGYIWASEGKDCF